MQRLSMIGNFFLVFCIAYCASESPIVNTKNGALAGTFERSRKGREFSAFKGIPFAQPPIGQLRFQPPEPAESWSGVRDATKDSKACLQSERLVKQLNVSVAEDCLYLNVYTPKLFNKTESEKKYPVMVWIHGGSYKTGTGNSVNYPPKFLLDKDVVLVGINYRLGPLGFLSTGDDVIRGNQGLKDQVMALRWVKENIAAFGGDPDSVTIFGESAGSASTHLLSLSPLSKGLFHRVISQSGTALNPWAFNFSPDSARENADAVGRALDCPTDDSQQLRDCLLKKDGLELTLADQELKLTEIDPAIPFKPVIEVNQTGAFLTQHPVEMMRNGGALDVPWLTGINANEGAILTSVLYGSKRQRLARLLNILYPVVGPTTLLLDAVCPKDEQSKVARKIRHFYLGLKPIGESTRAELTDMYTDALYTVAVSKALRERLEHQKSPVYFYKLAYRGTFSMTALFGDSERDYGVCHADDLFYFFPLHELFAPGAARSEDDEKMTDIMTSLWYNFAKTGNPTPEKTDDSSIEWKPVKTDNLEYLAINNPRDIKMSESLWKERIDFWRSLPCNAGLSIPSDLSRPGDS